MHTPVLPVKQVHFRVPHAYYQRLQVRLLTAGGAQTFTQWLIQKLQKKVVQAAPSGLNHPFHFRFLHRRNLQTLGECPPRERLHPGWMPFAKKLSMLPALVSPRLPAALKDQVSAELNRLDCSWSEMVAEIIEDSLLSKAQWEKKFNYYDQLLKQSRDRLKAKGLPYV